MAPWSTRSSAASTAPRPPFRYPDIQMIDSSSAAVGKEWPATSYEVGREKIREYAAALAIDAGIHRDHDVARAAGFRAVVAPPAFAAVYDARSLAGAMFDPGSGIFDPAEGLAGYRFVQRRQEFRWHEPVCAGDRIETVARLVAAEDTGGARYRSFESKSVNGDGELILEGRYEGVVPARGRSAADRLPREAGPVGETIRAAGSAAAWAPRGAASVGGFAAGDSFPELRITPDRWAPHRYAGASLDFTPFHLDADLAKAIGLPGIILHGLYTYGQLAHGLLAPFGSDPRVLRSLGARFRRPAVPERELLVTGTVAAVTGEGVEIACAVQQDNREVISEGVAELVPK
jgi:acyl dehydratase